MNVSWVDGLSPVTTTGIPNWSIDGGQTIIGINDAGPPYVRFQLDLPLTGAETVDVLQLEATLQANPDGGPFIPCIGNYPIDFA